jgi:hypothetical protein
VTIGEVFTECRRVPLAIVQDLHVMVERTEQPHGTRRRLNRTSLEQPVYSTKSLWRANTEALARANQLINCNSPD